MKTRSGKVGLGFAVLLALVAVVRIVCTYTVFCQTYDEPAKLVRGMEWLCRGTYTYVDHPPLLPVVAALGPAIDGAPCAVGRDPWADGNVSLYGGKGYFRTLSQARVGNLPFFLWSVTVVWLWSKKLWGERAGVLAVLLFTSLPAVLAHASVVGTDMAITAALATLLYVFQGWLERPNMSSSVVLGVAGGAALLSKFSAVVFFPVGALAIVGLRALAARHGKAKAAVSLRRRGALLGCSVAIAFYVVWTAYFFEVGPIRDAAFWRTSRAIDEFVERTGACRKVTEAGLELPVPAPGFFQGLIMIAQKEHRGHANYFWGRRRHAQGSWYFFPVILLVKTPPAFWALVALGALWLGRQAKTAADSSLLLPVAVPLAMVVAVLPSDINIGVRHILPVYPFLAMVATAGAIALYRCHRMPALGKAAAGILVLGHLVSSATAHPDYLAYFNVFAAGRRSLWRRFCIGSMVQPSRPTSWWFARRW